MVLISNFSLSLLFVFSELIDNLANFCPYISSLKLESWHTPYGLNELKWCSSITGFQNLEKLEINVYFSLVERIIQWEYYQPYLEMISNFTANPMPKMKELKLNDINAFFQDEFLIYLSDIFPNLETFNLVQLGQGEKDVFDGKIKKLTFWRYHNILPVLRCLGSIKNLNLPSMELVLAPWSYHEEHDQSIALSMHL